MLTTHFITNDPISADVLATGLQTAYYDVGQGEPLVFVHGFTGSKLDFKDQLFWFAESHRVIAFDQRGHGESSNIGPYSLYGLVADLISFLDALDIKRCHILGHSLGGMVVLRALLTHSQRFISSVLMDTAPYAIPLFDAEIQTRLNTLVQTQGCSALIDGMLGQPQSAAAERGMKYLGEAEYWRRIRVKLEQMDPAAFVALGDALAEQPSILNSLDTITLPTTVLVGAQDKPFTPAAKDLAGNLANAQLVTIQDAGHNPQYENAHAWRQAIETHLAQYGDSP